MRIWLFILGVIIVQFGCSQSGADIGKRRVLIDAEAMSHALATGDFKTYVKYMHPKHIAMVGGREKLIHDLEETGEQWEEDKTTINSVEVANPSREVECNGQLQCTLQQVAVISYSGGKPFELKSKLIGVSFDKGENWVFFNAELKDKDEMKKDYPEICDSLLTE